MKIVIAPDSFKESLSAKEVATAIKQGFSRYIPDAQYSCIPMADGEKVQSHHWLMQRKGD